jgi:hypothetical protein
LDSNFSFYVAPLSGQKSCNRGSLSASEVKVLLCYRATALYPFVDEVKPGQASSNGGQCRQLPFD